MNKNILLATSFAGALLGFSAHAQQSEPAGTQLGEVVVTAQRRAERLTDVPMTVAVVTAEQLQQRGVTDTTGLQRVTGGLQLPLYGDFLSPAIRGVSTAVTTSGAASNVAFYLDGVYQATQIGQLLDLPDAESIEILKGPQGTLYGQNAEGGAIVINTMAPSFTPKGKLSLGYGKFNDMTARAVVTGPLVGDVLAGSLAIAYEKHDGFRRGNITGKREKGLDQRLIRGKLLFQPSDSASITLTAYYARKADSSIGAGVPLPGESIAERFDPRLARVNVKKQYASEPAIVSLLASYGGSLRGKFDVGVGTVDAISSYSNNHARTGSDLDYTALNQSLGNIGVPQHAFIQEVNFVSNKFGSVAFTAGAYYQNSEEQIAPNKFWLFSSPPFGVSTIYPTPPTSTPLFYQNAGLKGTREVMAAFAELTYDLTEKIVISAGGRYTRDKAHGYFTPDYVGTPYKENTFSPQTWTNFSPRVTARYKLTENSNLYASYAKGFKSGVLNTNGDNNLPVDPEKLTAYEVGYKGTLFNRLYVNVAGFYYNYRNKQVAYYVAPAFVTQNAASARIKGIDVDFRFAVTPEFTLSGSGEYLDAKYRSYKAAGVYVRDPSTGGLANAALDVSGQRMDRAPKFSGSVTADYRLELEPGTFNANVSLYHSSTVLQEPSGRIRQKAYELVDGEIGFSPGGMPGLRFVVWGSNLTNVAYYQAYLETPYAGGVTYSAPRQFGGRVEYKF